MAWILVLVFVAKNVSVNLKMRIPFYLSVLLFILCVCVCARMCGFYALLVDLFACNEVHSIRHTPRIFKLELMII